MSTINSIYNINNSYVPIFKQKNGDIKIAINPILLNNSMSGINTLGNYNTVISNKMTSKLDIPILSPTNMPIDINQIKGKKTFNNSNGETTIIQNDNNLKKNYIFEKDGSYTFTIRDNDDNLLYLQSKNIKQDGVYIKVIKEFTNNDRISGCQALYKDGKLEHASKYIIPSNKSPVGYPYQDIGYEVSSKTYYIEKVDSNNKKIIQHFDTNLKPID